MTKIRPTQTGKVEPITPEIKQPVVETKGSKALKLFQSKLMEFDQNHLKLGKLYNKIAKEKNAQWLYNKKDWALSQLDRIKEIQKLHQTNQVEVSDLKKFNETIKKAETTYLNFIKAIQTKINTSPPPLEIKDHIKAKVIGPVESVLHYIGEAVNKILRVLKHGFLFEKMDSLLGDNQKVSSGTISGLNTLLQSENFKRDLRDVLINSSLADDKRMLRLTPTNFLNELLDQLAEVREKQLELLADSKQPLSLRDSLPNGTTVLSIGVKGQALLMALKIQSQYYQSENDKEILAQLQQLIGALIESAIPRNVQILTDCIFPHCVLNTFEIKSGPLERHLVNVAAAYKQEGYSKGYLDRGDSYLKYKTDWDKVKVRQVRSDDDVFVRGFCKISLQTPNGHETTSGAELDLSPLGDLRKEQVKTIFDLTATILDSSGAETLNKPIATLTNEEISKRTILVKELKKLEYKLHLSDEKIKVLRKIVTNFTEKITQALTLAMLKAGHKG